MLRGADCRRLDEGGNLNRDAVSLRCSNSGGFSLGEIYRLFEIGSFVKTSRFLPSFI